MEAADILGALQARVALVPGCRDLGERPVLLVPVPAENAPWTKERLDLVLRYFASIYSPETRRAGLTVVVDARSGPWRSARVAVRQVGASLGPDLALLLVLRPAAFWDKQRVDSCARAQRQREPILIPLSRLHKYVAAHQIPEELGGPWVHNHHQWIQNRIYMEAFAREAETAANDLDKLRGRLAGQQAMLSGESAATTNPTTIGAITISARINLEQPPVTLENYQQTKEMARQVVTAGRELLERLDKDYSAVACSVPSTPTGSNTSTSTSTASMSPPSSASPPTSPLTSPQVQLAVQQPVPQDVVDTRTRIERLLELLAAKQALLHDGWHNLQSTLVDAKELSALEDRVSQVTDWILGPAETMLNAQREVGLDVASAEELREAHESLELQCRDTYGRYAELLHRLDSRPAAGLPLPADLRSQRDFMDFACRSFATRLERRRTVLISSLRFYRLVDEYLETTADILEALMREGDVEALESVDEALRQLQRHQVDVDELERLVVRQGEKLSDLLSMPVKDALGREVSVDYEAHIGHVAALLEAVRARQALFSDSVTVRRLTLQQAGHVRAYEQDAAQAVRWLGELLRALLGSHAHVGCTPQEIQQQKAEQQALQETARTAHQYGAQLLALARSLRVSCRLTLGQHRVLADQLDGAWEALHAVSQEQMTRLRVSAVFHRSVQEHCKQLRELAAAVPSLAAEPDQSRRRSRLRKFLGSRERLLLEVGRMVRLGRLLRSRLREPLADPVPTASSTASPTAPLAGSPLGAPPPGPLCRLQSPLPSPVTVPGAAAAGINSSVTGGAATDAANGNATAIEAISERLSEVTALAEQLDRALADARLDPAAPPPPPSVEDATDAPGVDDVAVDTASTTATTAENANAATAEAADDDTTGPPAVRSEATTTEEWQSTLDLADSDASVREALLSSSAETSVRQPAEPQVAVVRDRAASESEPDFITASECTCTPPSRSSSFHTASEGGVTSPWWELGPTSEDGDDEPSTPTQRQSPSRVSEQVQTPPADDAMPPPVPAAAAVADDVKAVVQHRIQHLPDSEIHLDSCDEGEREVLVGVLTQREVRETRQLRVRRGGGETRAESELSCSRIQAQHINNACNASTSSSTSAASTLSSGTRGALEDVLQRHAGHDDVDAADAADTAYRQQLEGSLPLPLPMPLPLPLDLDLDLQLPSPLAFADPPAEYAPEYASEYDEHLVETEHESLPPPPPQELLDGLKESREWLQLRILESTPELTHLGATLEEALQLQRAHHDVLLKLQSKQSPVEELLRQADQLISTQGARAEVYAAMAESLGAAWRDVNHHLDTRKRVLDLNVDYHSRAEECMERMLALQLACTAVTAPILIAKLNTVADCESECESLKVRLAKIHDLRRAMLEALMLALTDGKTLLELLRGIAAEGSVDSRPDTMRVSTEFAISQVEHWLESLHDRRQALDLTFNETRSDLEQRLALAMLAAERTKIEDFITSRNEQMRSRQSQLGDSETSSQLLLHEHLKIVAEAKEVQERALKMTHATEQLAASGVTSAESAVTKSYAVLNSATEYLEMCDTLQSMLERAVAFYQAAHTALTKLDQLEIQLTTTTLSPTSQELSVLHAQIAAAAFDVSQNAVEQGLGLLDTANNNSTGAEGVKRTVEEIQKRRDILESLCTAHKEENIRLHQAINNFLEKHNNLYSWLVSRGEAFLQGHQDMGSVLAMARDFCEVHHSLIAELQVKGTEINNLLLTLPPILDQVEDVQRVEIDQKVDALHNLWLHLKQALEGRIDLSAQYLEFHEKAVQLAEQLDSLEDTLKSSATSEERQQILDERWANAQQLYGDLKNLGQSFITEAEKASDPYLDTKRAILCVETLLEHFAGRHITVAESRGVWQKSVTIEKETRLQWVNNLMESSRTVDWVSKLDAQLYPILTSGSPSATTIRQELEKKLETVLPEVRKAQNEIDDRIKNVQSLSEKLSSDEKQNEDGKDVLEKLTDLRGKLQTVLSDYQVLVQLLLSFFKNVIELEKTIDNFQLGDVVATENNVDTLLHEHDASKQTISELFKFTESESQQIIEKIRQQEPKDAAKSDEEFLKNLLADKFKTWEESCGIQRAKLEKNQQQGVFDRDLAQINYAIADLGRQLEAIRGQYGESLSSAKATSAAFDYFEKTIELLEQRIQTFVTTTKQAQSSSAEKLSDSEASRVDKELDQLQNRWSDFRGKVAESRKLIELSIQYFQLVEEAGEWFKEGSRLLVSIARRSAAVRFPESANELLAEMDTFLKPGEVKQDERIQKILELAKILYGEEKSQQVNVVLKENREMLDSFSTISRELNNLAKSLSQAEISEPQGDVEIKEIDVSDGENILSTITTTTSVQTIVTEKHTSESVLPTEKLDVNGDVEPKIEELTKEEIIIESSSVPSPNSEAENKGVIIEPVSSDETPDIKEEKEILIPAEFTEPLKDASIQEGGKFTFECKVTGKPAPEIVWEKDGISISNNPDYMTTQDGSVCTLTIEETFTEDSALYTCCATNSSGSSKTSAVLNVIESEPEETLNPPVFSVPLLDQTAREGAAHTLECLVEGLPLPTVQWYREENCIDDSPELAITYNNGQAKLRIEQVSLSDQAQYTCKANNTLGSASTSGRLSVEALKPTEGPSFSTPLSNVMARAGQKIKLECCVSGTPAPSLMWTHDGKPLKETRDVKTSYEGGRAILVISEAFPKDAGIYVLTASNPTSEVTSSCSVTVKGRLPTETSDSELASDMEPIKPSIQMALKDTEAKEGENIRLDCIIVGQPEPEVIWYHNDRPVKESADFQLLFHGDRCSLVLREALPEDAGLYRVVAINSAGEASSQCQLSVHAGEAEDVKEVPKPVETSRGPAEEVVAIAPKFTRLLADILAADGECVKLECAVEGKPKPTIRWCQNNKDVVASDRIQMTEREDGTITLIIQSVTADDRGVYTARASNSLGEAKCFSNLIVKSALSESKILELADRQVAPSFKEQFGDEVVLLGAPVKFECIVAGKPAPKVRWLFNDEPVSGKNFLVSKSGDRDVLSIQEADSNGCVSCTAENDAGKAACSAKLTVQDGFAELMSSIDGGGVSSSEEASQSFTMKRAVFMQTSSTTTSSTGTGPAQTQAHSVSTMSEQVSKKVDDEPVLQMQSEHKQEVRTVNNESAVKTESSVSVSQGGDERKETVVSTSGSTPAAAAAPAPLGPAKPTRKSTAPRFVTPLNGKIVDQGADILLEGILDGFPVPTITWTKNGVDLASLPEAASITTSWELNRVRLEMKGVSVRDAGRYTCRAVNPVGSATSTADIIVKKTVFPPVMGKRLQVQQARVGERIAMEVEVTGLPEPTITWTKDGLPLSAFPSLEVRTRTQGSCHTLVIDKATLAHAGNYAVKATNAGGESNCSADVAVWEALPEELMDQQQRDHIFRELMDFPAVQKHESFQTSKQSFLQTGGSSSSLVSREIPVSVVTTPAPAPPAAPATPAAAAAAGPAESLHISETTKTEKHFSVKVDRTSSPMLVKPVSETQAKVTTSTFSLGPDHRETNIPVETSTTVVHSREELDALSLLPKTSDLTFETQRVAEEENSAIDSSSIPTQTALQFFMTKIKEGERPPETKEPVAIPVQQKLTDKISMFERRDQDEPAACKSPELPREEVPVTKLSDKINLFEKYEGKPETREESKRFEEQIWKSYKHEPAPPAQAAAAVRSQPSPSLPEFVEPYMPGKQAKTEVQHSRVVQQETKTWSGTIQVPGKIVPSSYTQPITFKEESKTASYQKHYVSADAGPVGFGAAPDEFGLQPEPPPEMCYTPKPERATKVREDMAERVKKLQDSQKSLDPFQVPTGAVRIFPTPAPPSQPSTPQTPRAQPKTPQPQPQQQQQQRPVSPPYTHTPSFLYPAERPAGPAAPSAPERRPEVPAKEEPMVRQQVPPIEDTRLKKNAETVGGGVWTTPTACAAEVPPLPIKPTSVSSFTSTSSSSTSFQKSTETSSNTFLHTSTGPILRPAAAEVPVRATSPRPAAEAISMERLWTSHRTSESEKTTAFTPVAPKPAARPVSDGYTVSRDFASEASMYSSTEQRRGPSPRPSSEGLAMEKLWAPHKPESSACSYAVTPPFVPAPEPSSEAVDKAWPQRPSVKRSWPPPKPAEVEKIVIPWAPQNEPEKVWSPEAEVRPDKFEFERREREVVQGFRPVAAPAPPARPTSQPQPQPAPVAAVPPPLSFAPVEPALCTARDFISSEIIETKSEQFGSSSSWCQSQSSATHEQQSSIVEEKHIKPSEAKRIWPPNKPDYDLQAPFMVKKLQQRDPPKPKPQPAPEPPLGLEPGPPPEMGFAAPPSERRRSMVESIEEDLEKSLEKEPTRVVAGGVRVIPPPQCKSVPPPAASEDQFSWKQEKSSSFMEKKSSFMRKEEFKSSAAPRPVALPAPAPAPAALEPFPFQPEPERPRAPHVPPPVKPSKFIKSELGGSDYESDLETSRISAKWRPSGSDTEEPAYRRVRPPSAPVLAAQPAPPSAFERPAPLATNTVFREQSSKQLSSSSRVSSSVASTQSRFSQRQAPAPAPAPAPVLAPLNLKPGSPPEFVQLQPERSALKSTPDSPKSKHKTVRVVVPPESGYMADTDEPHSQRAAAPRLRSPPQPLQAEQKYESRSSVFESSSCSSTSTRMSSMVSTSAVQSMTSAEALPAATVVARASSKGGHRHERRSAGAGVSAFKEVVAPVPAVAPIFAAPQQQQQQQQPPRQPLVEPAAPAAAFAAPAPAAPAAPAPVVVVPAAARPGPKRAAGPLPRSPSKFVKGEFRESDYDSDHDGPLRIPAVWRPGLEDVDGVSSAYRPVRPVLAAAAAAGAAAAGRPLGRTPTPPTEFDHPAHAGGPGGPPRPKFQPIEKQPLAAVKAKAPVRPVAQPHYPPSAAPVFKPTPVPARPPERIETLVAVPAVPAVAPGPPPQILFSSPHAPTMHETSQSMSFAEATETSRRVVSMQQTTRVIKFNESSSSSSSTRRQQHQQQHHHHQQALEPFPFLPEPEHSVRKTATTPPPPKPSKFVPGEFRESDYESELEAVRFRAKWAPNDSDTDEPHYRKVRPPQGQPSFQRCSSVPVETPDFSRPVYVPAAPAPAPAPATMMNATTTTSQSEFHAEQKRLQRVEEMRRRFEERKSTTTSETQTSLNTKSLRRLSAPIGYEVDLVPGPPAELAYAGPRVPPQAEYIASRHMNEMTQTFKSKAQRFVNDIMTDSRTTKVSKPEKPILKKQSSTDAKAHSQNGDESQAYREESRVAEYGTKHIDPDTGLIYFKYDFGYEFGIILPGEGKATNGKAVKRARMERALSHDEGGVDFPVLHERSGAPARGFSKTTEDIKTVPQFRPKKFTHFKSVKWEPTSESEMSEAESDANRWKRRSLPQPLTAIDIPGMDVNTPSPVSLSPSVPSLSPHTTPGPDSSASLGGSPWTSVGGKNFQPGQPAGHSGVPVNSAVDTQQQKAPVFITPLRDIAVVNGQSARFECIVQAEPPPNILWSKDGRILESSPKTQILFRNGVCRLAVANATSVDAGTYICTATNRAGTTATTATLLVPGERKTSLSNRS